MMCPNSANLFAVECGSVILTAQGFTTSSQIVEKCVHANLQIGSEKCSVSLSINRLEYVARIDGFFKEWVDYWGKPFIIELPHLGIRSQYLVKVTNDNIEYSPNGGSWDTALRLSILSKVTKDGDSYSIMCNGVNTPITISKTLHFIKPTLTLIGDATIQLEQHLQYVELGATAIGKEGQDLTPHIQTVNNLNMLEVGVQRVQYSVTDEIGNTATIYRSINIIATQNPVIINRYTDRYIVPSERQEPTITTEQGEIVVVPSIIQPTLFDNPSIFAESASGGVLTQVDSTTKRWETNSSSNNSRYMFCRISVAPHGLLTRNLVAGERIRLTGRIKASHQNSYIRSSQLDFSTLYIDTIDVWEDFGINCTVKSNISINSWLGFFSPPGETIEVQNFNITAII